jgi:hypothetical protein
MCRAGTKTFVLLVLSLLTLATAAAAGPRVLEESIDADFAKINDQVPGFGGMFVDADGVVKVYMTDAGKADLLRGALEEGVEILEGRYEFNELQGWRVKLREVLGLGASAASTSTRRPTASRSAWCPRPGRSPPPRSATSSTSWASRATR